MQITLFGLVWLCFAIGTWIADDLKFAVVFTLISMTLQCSNVIAINGTGIGPQLLASLLLLIRLLLKPSNIVLRNDKSTIIGGFFFIFIMVVSTILNLGTLDFSTELRIVQYCAYFLTFLLLRDVYLFSKKSLRKIMVGLSYYLLIIGLIQLITCLGLFPRLSIISEIFYNDSGVYNTYYPRVASTFMEPSYFAPVICSLIFYFFFDEKKDKHHYIILILSLIEFLLTFSSTAYGAFGVTFVLYILLDRNQKHLKRNLVTMISLSIICLMLFCFTDIIQTVIFDKLDFAHSASGSARRTWDLTALEAFYSSKWIGVGYKQCRASSCFYQLLGELGILGFSAFFIMMFGQIKYIFKSKSYLTVFSWMVLVSFLCLLIAVPDLDMCSFWLIMYIFSIAGSSIRNVKKIKVLKRKACLNSINCVEFQR